MGVRRASARAFGKPIGTFQASRFALAEMVTKTRAARVYVDQCIVALNAGELTAAEAAGAKYWTTDVLRGGRRAPPAARRLRLHGRVRDQPALARRPRQRIYGGTNEIMKEIVGRSLGF